MNNLPRQKLCEIIAQYGHSLRDDPRRTEALLRDFCGEYKREIFVLVSALRERVAADLLTLQDSMPHEVLLARLTKRLQDDLALAEDAARWAVESWALALGVIEHPLPGPPPGGEREPACVAMPMPPRWGRPLEPVSDRAPLPQAVTDERLLRRLEKHTGWVNSIAFHPNGRILASGSHDGTVRLWDVTSGQEMQWPLQGTAPVYSVAFSPDGRTLAWGSGDGTVQLRDVSAAPVLSKAEGLNTGMARGRRLHQLKGHVGEVNSVAFSPDGRTLASDSDKTVVLWDVTSGREVRQLRGHRHVVQSVAFSPDGRLLASAGGDKTVRLWGVSAGPVLSKTKGLNTGVASGRAVQVRRLEGHTEPVWSVAFSPDGHTLASGSHDKTVRIWDAVRSQVARLLEKHPGGVNSVAFSPDGRLLASASLDTVVLWDLAQGRIVGQLKGHTHLVQSVAFSPDGRMLASGSWDKTVRLWQVGNRR